MKIASHLSHLSHRYICLRFFDVIVHGAFILSSNNNTQCTNTNKETDTYMAVTSVTSVTLLILTILMFIRRDHTKNYRKVGKNTYYYSDGVVLELDLTGVGIV